MRFSIRNLKKRRSVLSAACVGALLCGCGGGGNTRLEPVAPHNLAACTDYYAYANHDWLAATPVPAGTASINGSTGVALANQTALLGQLRLLAAAGPGGATGPDEQALVALFASRADTGAVERSGIAPLAEDLALIERMTGTAQLPAVWGQLIRRGVALPVTLQVETFDDVEAGDPALHTDRLSVAVESPDPGLAPSDDHPGRTWQDFRAHIARTLQLSGMTQADAVQAAVGVADIEHALAALASPESDDDASAPWDLPALLAAAGVPQALPRRVDDSATGALGRLLAAFTAQQWRAFTRWRLIVSYSDYLPARFAAERATWKTPDSGPTFDEGRPVDPQIAFLSRVLPRQLDLFFGRRVLPADTATHTQDIGQQVGAALHRHLDTRTWLDAASRAATHRLADTVELVFPAIDDSAESRVLAGLAAPRMQADTLLANVRTAAGYELDRRFAIALASRTSRSATGDAWSQLDAHYNFLSHSVLIGPVTVQTLLAPATTTAARYGALGTVIAHELLHMYGAPGDRQFSPRQPIDWIDVTDRANFSGMVATLEKDYADWVAARFHAAAKSPRFMGEDLSDLGSVPVALSALRQAEPSSSDDAFYRAFAYTQRTRQSAAEDLADATTVASHAIHDYRINGPLSNFAPFAQTYGCTAGDGMVRGAATRVELW